MFTLSPILYYPMSEVKTDGQGRLILPDAFLQRWRISSATRYGTDEELWVQDIVRCP